MNAFFILLPIYLLGNLHCFGMCGPLVFFIARHRFRNMYFLGRLISFSIAGFLSARLGQVITVSAKENALSGSLSFIFGSVIALLGLSQLMRLPSISLPLIQRKVVLLSKKLAELSESDRPLPIFFFGLATVLLPCGQTLIVFTTLALHASALEGLINGALFALMTSPSLFFAMKSHDWLKRYKHLSGPTMGALALFIALLSFLRGFADLGWIPHLSLGEVFGAHMVIY